MATAIYFSPETVTLMKSALDDAWDCLEPEAQATVLKTTLAVRILESARKGERDCERLRGSAKRSRHLTLGRSLSACNRDHASATVQFSIAGTRKASSLLLRKSPASAYDCSINRHSLNVSQKARQCHRRQGLAAHAKERAKLFWLLGGWQRARKANKTMLRWRILQPRISIWNAQIGRISVWVVGIQSRYIDEHWALPASNAGHSVREFGLNEP